MRVSQYCCLVQFSIDYQGSRGIAQLALCQVATSACFYRFLPSSKQTGLFRKQRDNAFICVRYYLKSENCILTLVVECDQRTHESCGNMLSLNVILTHCQNDCPTYHKPTDFIVLYNTYGIHLQPLVPPISFTCHPRMPSPTLARVVSKVLSHPINTHYWPLGVLQQMLRTKQIYVTRVSLSDNSV